MAKVVTNSQRGGSKPGERRGGRQKGTPNKVGGEIREVAKAMTPKATKRLEKLLESDNETVAMAAIKEVYDRAYGKSAQPHTGEGGEGPVAHTFGWLNTGT